jgi:hypothetical protein
MDEVSHSPICFLSRGMKLSEQMLVYNRLIRKVRETQHQNPEFGHTQAEIKKKPAKKYISIQRGMKLRKPSILVVN